MDILRLLTESLLGDSESDGESDDDSDDEDVQEENDEEANKAAELKLVLLEGIPLTHVACAYCDRAGQQYEAINLLLEGGIANLADTDKYKRTAAHVAAFKGKLGFLEKLYDGEADILQMKDYTGRTALDVAILKGHTHVIDWIKLQTETDPR
ncbi:hypothetical protein SARC_02545 [Sphaeroforma arctica JP610]|uniref:Uncharacterized protein n=1 Tax=Sphaeroforma arctica JP610 TaxID=667725 RepID=A0A0L0G8L3_9EUKA|nr:hypothetical protein SARC_02545 [Sphaeroforma arctica JP610]KNC85249.1 hypothetical protein SARC_02545 [Sphaeroforma arctica JP610]|eukprot:XP_014159151.1 hypothetical protein SARC_02545 [Sphaeroforma arctica JP610]